MNMPQVVSLMNTDKVMICISIGDLKEAVDNPDVGEKLLLAAWGHASLQDDIAYRGIKGKIKNLTRKL